MCYHVYVIMYVKDPWLLGKSRALCAVSRLLAVPVGMFYMYYHIDMITHGKAFVEPVSNTVQSKIMTCT